MKWIQEKISSRLFLFRILMCCIFKHVDDNCVFIYLFCIIIIPGICYDMKIDCISSTIQIRKQLYTLNIVH